MPSLPPRENRKFCSVELPAMGGCGIVRIWYNHLTIYWSFFRLHGRKIWLKMFLGTSCNFLVIVHLHLVMWLQTFGDSAPRIPIMWKTYFILSFYLPLIFVARLTLLLPAIAHYLQWDTWARTWGSSPPVWFMLVIDAVCRDKKCWFQDLESRIAKIDWSCRTRSMWSGSTFQNRQGQCLQPQGPKQHP